MTEEEREIINAIKVMGFNRTNYPTNKVAEVISKAIKALEQQEKTAAWVPTDEEPHEVYECNACGWLLCAEDRTDFKYCPNCGARMVSK